MSEEKGIMFYTAPRGYGKTYYELEKLRKENQQLKEKYLNAVADYETTKSENQQLKEELKLVESLTCFNMPDNIPMVCMFKADYERNKYEYETLDKYKSVLDEIREVIDFAKTTIEYGRDYSDVGYNFLISADKIVEILDKVKE